MRYVRTPLALALALGAAPLAAQEAPRDSVRLAAPPADTLFVASGTTEEPAAPPSRWGTPFAVETSGTVGPRPPRGEVVWVAPAAPARSTPPAAVPTTPARDTLGPAPRPPARLPAASTPSRPTNARPAARPRSHAVAPGETFYGIARRYDVSSAALRAANPDARWENLRTGDTLRIPAAAASPTAGGRTGGTPARTTPAPRGRRTHTVARGETLFGIARRYGVPAAEIRRANRMEGDWVRIGQTLTIPAAR